MHKFVRELITEWRKLGLPFSDKTLLVGASGGVDSSALLLALADLTRRKKLDLKIVVAHFNHKLRGPESDNDERFVKALAKTCGFMFIKANGEFKGKSNLEERARNARYEFLAETARKRRAQYVLTAHTQNDQAETFLLNLIRGSGTAGLGGMRTVRELGSGGGEETGDKRRETGESVVVTPLASTPLLVRPFLSWATRADTESFCRQSGVEFRNDSMNDDRSFARVRVRKDVIPLLRELNPKIIETLARTSELLRVDREASKKVAIGDEILISEARKLEKNVLYTLLRAWIREKRGNTRGLQLKHISAVRNLIHSPKSGRIVELPGGAKVVKSGGRLAFRDNKLEN